MSESYPSELNRSEELELLHKLGHRPAEFRACPYCQDDWKRLMKLLGRLSPTLLINIGVRESNEQFSLIGMPIEWENTEALLEMLARYTRAK